MSLLFRVLYAAHARGTHHKLALDALELFEGPDAQQWQRLLLKHAQRFMVGAKAPDDTFKDFKNHVLHPRDGFWGGAPRAAREWYDKLVAALKAEDWSEAAYAAGVLSHYVTDPVHPFHTGQAEAEGSIHRAFEWSTAKSYPALRELGANLPRPHTPIPAGADWLEALIRDAASQSNAHYEKLIAHYDINKGVVDPPAGLDLVAQRLLAELIRRASALFAVVVQKGFAESGVRPPEVSLTLDTILATLQIPLKTLVRRMEDKADRKTVERMYDELRETGTVEVNLPEDDRMVRDLHAVEVKGHKQASVPAAKAAAAPPARSNSNISTGSVPNIPLTTPPKATTQPAPQPVAPRAPEVVEPTRQPLPAAAPSLAARLASQASQAPPRAQDFSADEAQSGTSHARGEAETRSTGWLGGNRENPRTVEANDQAASHALRAVPAAGTAPAIPVPLQPRADSGPDVRLKRGDPIVDAPSIGPRMAERLEPLGLKTVADLLAAKPGDVARKLNLGYVNEAVIAAWQAQAELVCTVPGLSGTGAQLLVGAGYRTAEAVGDAEPEKLCAEVLRFAATSAGQRLLRNGNPPDMSRIKAWAEAARTQRAA